MFEPVGGSQAVGLQPIILAIDFGTQRIGLAISRGSLAEPLKIIENSTHAVNDPHVVAEIKKVIDEEGVMQLVIGLSENTMAEKTRQFAEELRAQIKLPLKFVDETLSSHSVHEKLQFAGRAKRGQPIDHYAAAEFLQEYLDLE